MEEKHTLEELKQKIINDLYAKDYYTEIEVSLLELLLKPKKTR